MGDGKQIKNDLEMKISRKRMKDFLDWTLFIIFVPFQTGAEMKIQSEIFHLHFWEIEEEKNLRIYAGPSRYSIVKVILSYCVAYSSFETKYGMQRQCVLQKYIKISFHTKLNTCYLET